MAYSRSALNEAQTRQQLIDQHLAGAGCGTAERRVVEEYLLSSAETEPDYGQQPLGKALYGLRGDTDGRMDTHGQSLLYACRELNRLTSTHRQADDCQGS
jgi:hypothetical protein